MSSTLRISDPAELPRAAGALGRHGDGMEAVRREVQSAAGRIGGRVDSDVTTLRDRLRRAEQYRDAVDRRDEAAARQADAACERAGRALGQGLAAQREIDRILTDLRRETESRVSASRALSEQGSRGLRSFWERLDRSRSAFASAVARHRTPGGVADPRRVRTGRTSPGPTGRAEGPVERLVDEALDKALDEAVDHIADGLREQILDSGEFPTIGDGRRVLVPLDRLVDLDPISGPAAFEKVPLTVMCRGLRLLEEQVIPAVRRGLGREQIRAMDDAAGTAGSPEGLLAVYDAFFGGDEHAVVVTRRPDGTLAVHAGRHRFWAAQRMLLTELPVLVR